MRSFYIHVFLSNGHQVPPAPYKWHEKWFSIAEGWDSFYDKRLQIYSDLFSMYNITWLKYMFCNDNDIVPSTLFLNKWQRMGSVRQRKAEQYFSIRHWLAEHMFSIRTCKVEHTKIDRSRITEQSNNVRYWTAEHMLYVQQYRLEQRAYILQFLTE